MALTKEDLQAIGELMDDKLEKSLKPINTRLDKLEQGQKALEQGQKHLEESVENVKESLQVVRKSQMTVELELTPKIKAAFDGFTNAKEKNEQQDGRIAYLEQKTDNHDIRIFALEQAVK